MKRYIIRSVTGREIDLGNFKPADVEAKAIFAGLSKECRFAKQIEDFYSVAQHSVHVMQLLREESLHVRRFALIHDASEAYIGDVSRQLKHSPYMAGYRILEEEVQQAIEDALLPPTDIAILDDVEAMRIKAADDLMAIFERVVVRDRGRWDVAHGREHVEKAYGDGYVSYTRQDSVIALLPYLDIVADGFSCWEHALARKRFEWEYDELFDRFSA